jgi:hypothetical protein
MNIGIGNKVAEFHFWEYTYLIFGAVCTMLEAYDLSPIPAADI